MEGNKQLQGPKPNRRINLSPGFFKAFVHSQQFSGILLLVCTLFSLLVTNYIDQSFLPHLWHTSFGFELGKFHFIKPLEFWINDGLMGIFFLLVGLEIKREFVNGELAGFKKASLPLAAALGGMLLPAFIYLLFNHHSPQASGWGIPMATDIAFALGILSLAGDRVPLGLKVFLTALAVVDDLGAIVVIALFYTSNFAIAALLKAGLVLLLLVVMNRLKVKVVILYLIAGIFLWYFVLQSGIHATIAGVLLALCIPISDKPDESMLHKMELDLHEPVNFLIMPLFALCNTSILINAEIWAEIPSKLIHGIQWGLIIGKPVGILLFSYLVIKARWSVLPQGVNWRMMTGAGLLAGIGFTMSIFISMLAFNDLQRIEGAKIAVLIASTLSGLLGLLWFRWMVSKS